MSIEELFKLLPPKTNREKYISEQLTKFPPEKVKEGIKK